jgi:hypothetical protein
MPENNERRYDDWRSMTVAEGGAAVLDLLKRLLLRLGLIEYRDDKEPDR